MYRCTGWVENEMRFVGVCGYWMFSITLRWRLQIAFARMQSRVQKLRSIESNCIVQVKLEAFGSWLKGGVARPHTTVHDQRL